MQSDGLITRFQNLVGGDFVVFRTASEVVGTGAMIPIYNMEYLSDLIASRHPNAKKMLLAWMYPPTMLMVVSPLALMPFTWAFAAWVSSQLIVFAASFRALWKNKMALFLGLASPAIFQSVITGQTGMLTASLLALSGYYARSRPVLAGVAAGMLTIKPQFGLLIPLAFAAARCWKAFGVAFITAVTMAVSTIMLWGTEPWLAFAQSLSAHGDRLSEAKFTFEKLATPFGQSRLLGASLPFAQGLQLVVSILLAGYVVACWSKVKGSELRVAALSSSSLLVTPYAFYYELPILVFPVAMIASVATQEGWLRFERLSIFVLGVLCFLPPGSAAIPSLSLAFLPALLAFVICARRVVPAMLNMPSVRRAADPDIRV
jgi:hypothetical protein